MIRAGGGQVFLEKKGEGFTVDYAVLGNDKPNTSEKTPATSLANTSLYWRNWAKRHDIKASHNCVFALLRFLVFFSYVTYGRSLRVCTSWK